MKSLFLTLFLTLFACAVFAQANLFIEYAPTLTSGHVGNPLHYNNENTQLGQGFSYGFGWIKPMKKHPKLYSYWAFMSNRRSYEINRLQPYSNDPTAITPLRREARGIEILWGTFYKKMLTPQITFLVGGGITQNIVGKQFQWKISASPQQTETFGVGSATFRNRIFMRTGIEIRTLQKLAITVEPCLSFEIKPLFVHTIDKINPITYGLNFRAVYVRK